MAKETLVSLLLFLSLHANAYVTVLSPKGHCEHTYLQRSIRGLKLSLEEDPTDAAPVNLSKEQYSIEALESIDKVLSVYREIFKQRGMSEDESANLLEQFRKDDRALVEKAESSNGLDNTVYFVRKNPAGEYTTILRATYLKKGDPRKLHLEKHVALPDGNRIELERAFNARSPNSQKAMTEMLMVLAQFSKDYFDSNDYNLYLLTDKPRGRDYRMHYGFESEVHPELDPMIQSLGKFNGAAFFDRFVGHVDRAYQTAFSASMLSYPFMAAPALKILTDEESKPGMKGYIPNLVGQLIIHAAHRHYEKAIEISDQMRALGEAQVNEDFYHLWKSRVAYDSIQRKGDPKLALKIVDDYLKARPLKLDFFNYRALLFTIYRLKIFLATENFFEAENILKQHKELLLEGRGKMYSVTGPAWDLALTSMHRGTRLGGTKAYVDILLDVSTFRDQFNTAVLYPAVWKGLAYLDQELGNEEEKSHCLQVEQILKKYFPEGEM